MGAIQRLWQRLRHAFRHRQLEAELAEEIEQHRRLTEEALARSGVNPVEGRITARRTLGNDALAMNDARDVWIPPWLQDIAQDVRFGARMLGKDRRFTMAAVLALGLGIGLNSSMFSLYNTAILRELPFEESDRVVSLRICNARRACGVSYPDFQEWRRASTAFAGIGASDDALVTLSDETRSPERIRGTYISANAFGLVRTQPVLGRDFRAEDDEPGAPPVVMLGFGVWKDRYGGRPDVIGQRVRVNEVPSTIIGVMPDGFRFPFTAEMWLPLAFRPGIADAGRTSRPLIVFGRLADGVELAHGLLATIRRRTRT
jgi:hypothetical protein